MKLAVIVSISKRIRISRKSRPQREFNLNEVVDLTKDGKLNEGPNLKTDKTKLKLDREVEG